MKNVIKFDLTDALAWMFGVSSLVTLVLWILGFTSQIVVTIGGDHFFKLRSLLPMFIAFTIFTVLTIVFGYFSGRKYKFSL